MARGTHVDSITHLKYHFAEFAQRAPSAGLTGPIGAARSEQERIRAV